MLFLVGCDHLQQRLLLRHCIRLIDHQHTGYLERLNTLNQLQFRLAGTGDRLHHQHRRIHVADAGPDYAVHVFPQPVTCFVKSRRIGKYILTPIPVHNAADTIARGLRFAGDDGDFLSH